MSGDNLVREAKEMTKTGDEGKSIGGVVVAAILLIKYLFTLPTHT